MHWCFRKTKLSVYTRLPSATDEVHAIQTTLYPSAIWLALAAVCVGCTVLNAGLLVLLKDLPNPVHEDAVSRIDISSLRRPSQYIQLDFVERPSPPIPLEFDNHPILTSIVDSNHPHKVAEVDARRYMSHNGMISPAERHIMVTDTKSTILQFRAIDYGMELCELHVHLPSLNPGLGTEEVEGPSVVATLYRLNSTRALDERTVSYASRPSRVYKVDDITVTPWYYRFSCKSEEVLTFELAHPSHEDGAAMDIEWWQNDDNLPLRPALYMKQRSTK